MLRTFGGLVGRLRPAPWLRAGAAGLALLTVVVALGAAAAAEPDQKEKKGEGQWSGDVLLPGFPGFRRPATAAEILRLQEAMRRRMEEINRQALQALQQPGPLLDPASRLGNGRLGVFGTPPGDTLVEQLDLPNGQGLVVAEVRPDSPAARAGLKKHDILLEVNGKPVPAEPEELARQLEDVKPDTAIDVLVLRKGKRETIKGLKLPEAGPAAPPAAPLPLAGGAVGVQVSTVRTDDRFTTRYQEGTLVITVTGTVADGKAKVSGIELRDADGTAKYDRVDKVPARYREKVASLVEQSARGSVQVEIQFP
jgi:hypothetical protein